MLLQFGPSNTCIETTSRFAAELGYHATLVKDARNCVQPGNDEVGARVQRAYLRTSNLDDGPADRGALTRE